MTNYQGTDSGRLSTLTEVARAVGTEIAALIEVSPHQEHIVSGAILYDAAADPLHYPGAIALAVGMPLDGDSRSRFTQLCAAGYVALVYKAHGADDSAIRQAARDSGLALFRASDSVPWDRLADFFQAATIPQGESRRSLVDVRPGDLFELANTVASLVGGAVAIADPEQTVLAYSTLPHQPIDDTRRRSILQLHVPPTKQNDEDYRLVHLSHGVVSVTVGPQSLTRSAAAIRAGSVVLGSLWLIDADIPQSDQTARVLLEAANVAAVHLLHRRNTHDAFRARQIELVRPLLFEPDRAELAAVQLGISAESLRVATVMASGPPGTAPESIQSSMLLFDTVRAACAVWLPEAVCGLADNLVYIVLPVTSSAPSSFSSPSPRGSTPSSSSPGSSSPGSSSPGFSFQHEAVVRITHHARRVIARPVLTGIGSREPVIAAEKSRRESETVLAMLLRNVEDGRVRADSDEIVADRQSIGPRLELRQIANALEAAGGLPGSFVTAIVEHDARRKTSFETTLRTYLDCDSNAIETANRLGLHANTVRYRLSRVEPLFGIRLDDPEFRLLIWIQLSARQLQ